VTFSRGAGTGLYTVRADDGREVRQLLALEPAHWLVGWTQDARTLVYGAMEGTPSAIMALTGGKIRRIVGPSSTWGGRLSPDGRWLAYYSLDSGNFEVIVTRFPDGGDGVPIAEGTDPNWSLAGNEIYFRSGNRLMAVRIEKAAAVRAVSTPRVVIDPFLPPLYDDYDIHPDGRQLVFVRPSGTQPREVVAIVNWSTDLQRAGSASK
jgi:hypothetical protein